MKIQYLGHACFRLISDMGTTVVCDPYKSEMVGITMPRVRADVVTVSHHHEDHDYTENVSGSPAVLDCEVQCCADDIEVCSIETYHDEVKGAKRGKNLVFCFVIDGLKVVHLGDIGCFDLNVVKHIANCDIMLLPVGGVFTVDALGAKQYVDAVKPKIVIPMHFKSDGHNFEIDSVNKFLSLFSKQDTEISVSDTLSLYDSPQNETAKIVVLQKFE